MAASGIWAVVPCKTLSKAKERLAAALDRETRRALAMAMLEDVLDALAQVEALVGILVVTCDPALARLADRRRLRLLLDECQAGPSEAIGAAARLLAAERAGGMIAVPADVPLATAAELAQVIAGHEREPLVTLVPALADRGTNAIAATPADAVPFRFGRDSFAAHQAVAAERGVPSRSLVLPGLGLDLDRPADLLAFLARPSATRSYELLASAGIGARLRPLEALATESAGPGQ